MSSSSSARKSSCSAVISASELPPMLPRPPTRKWVTFDDLEGAAAIASGISSASSPVLTNTMASSSTTLVLSSSEGSSVDGGRMDFSKSLGSDGDFESSPGKLRKQRQQQQRLSDSSLDDDRYSAFCEVRRGKRASGWSGKILHGSHVLGWSDEVLECGASSDDSADAPSPASSVADSQRPNSICVEDGHGENWYASLRNPSWDQSPDRRFVRNFP